MRFLSGLLLLVLVARPLSALADDSVTEPVPAVPYARPMTESEIQRRLTFIQTTLEERDDYAKFWKYGWMTVFGVGAAGQLVIGLAADDVKIKNDAYVGAVTALLGTIGMAISKVDSGRNLRTLHEYPYDATTDGVAKLALAERLLADTADGERYGRGWQEYLQSALVSGTAGTIMWVVYDQPESFWLKAGSGVVFSIARIQTTPRAATRAWEAYQRDGGLTPVTAGLGGQPGLGFVVTPAYATVTYRF